MADDALDDAAADNPVVDDAVDEALHERALYLAGAIEVAPERVDPVEAGTVGADHLDRFVDGGATPEAVELGVFLLDFALARSPEHEDADRWRYRAGDALSFLAEETDSTARLDAAIAHLTAVARTTGDFADPAAAELAALTATRLAVAARDEDLDVDAVRRLTDVLAELDPADPERVDFLLQRALAHRWAYPRTLDPADLDRVVDGMAAVLPELEPDEEARVEALEALIAVHEERFLLTKSLEPLEEALATAREARSLLADDPERGPEARAIAAALVTTRYWNSADHDDADRDEAIAEYTALDAEVGLEDRHARNYGFLLCFRGGVTGNADDLRGGIDVLETVEEDWYAAGTIAEAHEALVALDGPHHLWDAIEWGTRALTHPAPDPDDGLALRTQRLEAVEAAARQFGIGAVLDRCDARAVLADADTAVRTGTGADPQVRARLAVRSVVLRTQWMAEFLPVGDPDALRAAVQEQIDLLTEVKATLPAADHDVVHALTSLVDIMRRAFVGDSGGAPGADMDGLVRALLSGPAPTGPPPDGPLPPETEAEHAMTAYLRAVYERAAAGQDPRALIGDFTALVWQVDALPPSEQRDLMEQMLTSLSRMVGPPGGFDGSLPRLGDTEDGEVARLFGTAGAWRAAVEAGDSRRALWAYQAVERAAAGVRPGATMEVAARMVQGMTRARLGAVVPTDPAVLDADIAALEAACRDGGGVDAAVDLGSRLRLRDRPGDRAASREAVLAALVAGSGDGGAAGPGTGEVGDNVTAWCLDDGADDDLVRVLEARRAAEVRGGDAVVTGPDEVRQGLRAAGADVLAYLVPDCGAHRGMAVVVPVDGPVRVVGLPDLTTTPLARFAATRDARFADPRPATVRAWRASLSDVCAWAWQAAGAELVAAAGGGRLVLVPVGPLGLVPWPAAWREVDGRRRYLVEDVEVSSAPSGRVLALAAGRAAATGAAVFVGNPNRDDAPAAVAAEELRDSFHPDGRFLGGHGQPPRPWRVAEDGAGTPEEVRAALAGGVSVLHLGCRAVSDVDAPDRSRVTLHDGKPFELGPLDADLVTLTGHASTDGSHDDARTLPAAFLALGARSVLATRWPAPTAHLVHLVHQHWKDSPGTALRTAQLRVLDPAFDRSTLPPHLHDMVPPDPAEIEHWAALAHFGR